MKPRRLFKHSGDVVDYRVDLASNDGTNDGSSSDTGWLQGDLVDGATITLLTEGPVVVAQSVDDTGITVWFSGGMDKKDYYGDIAFSTAGGRTKVIPFRIIVRDRD